MKIFPTILVGGLVLTAPALAAPSPSTPPSTGERAVYRFDFELVTTEPGKPAATTAFSLNLDEGHVSEAMIGDNVPLAGSGGVSGGAMRQNVGIRIGAHFEPRGGDLLVEVDSELSAMAAGSVMHKLTTKGFALASPGKKALVAVIDHDHVRTQLSLTPTRL
jgi:hypothetical protein